MGVGVVAGEMRLRVLLRHEDQCGSVAAADVGDTGACPEMVRHSLEGGDPVAEQAGPVADLPEPFGGREDCRVLLAPRDTPAGAEGLGDLAGAAEHSCRQQRRPRP